MFRYNKISYIFGHNDLSTDSEDDLVIEKSTPTDSNILVDDIQPRDTNIDVNTNILDSIIQHPYIENLPLDLNKLSLYRDKIYLVIYRINKYGENMIVEFFLTNDFLSLCNTERLLLTTQLYDTLRSIPGTKRFTGELLHKDNMYTFVQVRDNTDYYNWVSIWDIIVNKQYFGEKFNDNVIDFFTINCDISTLIFNKKRCMSPIVLYSCIDDRHRNYVHKTHSVQYCQKINSTLITLNQYKEYDNVRTICFLEDMEFSDTLTNLSDNNYIILKDANNDNNIHWIFKNEKNIFSYVK